MESINVLSLFDGISCGRIALDELNIKVKNYYSSEIDKYAIQISDKNYPDIIRLGDVLNWRKWDIDWSSIDLILAGSPCQGFSFAGKQLAFDDPRSKLFFEFENIVKHIQNLNPNVKFLLENVRMKKEYQAIISNRLSVEPVMLNSALVSAQNRVRLYWTNWDISKPLEDKNILLKDVLQDDAEVDERMITKSGKSFCLTARYQGAQLKNSIERKQRTMVRVGHIGNGGQSQRVYSTDGKSVTLSALGGGQGAKTGLYIKCAAQRGRNIIDGKRKDIKGAKTEQRLEIRKDSKTNCLTTAQKDNLIVKEATKKGFTEIAPGNCVDLTFPNSKTRRGRNMENKCNCLTAANFEYCRYTENFIIRKLTPIECERLQTLPDNYTDGVSNTQRYKALGNGWTVAIIKHLLSQLYAENNKLQP